jgi:hypothetical protein
MVIAGIVACVPKRVFKATTEFAQLARTSVAELGGAPELVGDLCRQRAELAYIRRVHAPRRSGEVHDFHAFFHLLLPGARDDDPQTSWREICARYRLADAGFAKGLATIAAYGEALDALARDRAPVDLNGFASSAAAAAAALSASAERLKSAIGGLGQPISELATAVLDHWKATEMRALVRATDRPLHDVICELRAFLQVVREEQLADARATLVAVLASYHALPDRPVGLLQTIAMIDVEMTRRLDRIEVKLEALDDVLQHIARAHSTLVEGWNANDELETVREIARLAKEVHGGVARFHAPEVGAGRE